MYDAIVIGVGTMGAAACDTLSRRGLKVLGIDQFSPPHSRGAHHGDTRMFRMAYYEHPDYVPLLKRSRDLWLEMNRAAPSPIYHEVGGLYMGPETGELFAGSARAAKQHYLKHEVLSRGELRSRFPQFILPPDFMGLYEPHAGFVMSELAIERLLQTAEHQNATIAKNQKVLGWESDSRTVTVRTDSATHAARSLIITSGAWSSRLLSGLGIKLIVTSQVLGWVSPADRRPFLAGHFPCWGVDGGDGSLLYGFPLAAHETSLKLARHFPGRISDPDTLDRTIAAEDESDFRTAIARHLPAAAGPTARTEVCMYTNSPDSHFIIDTHPRHPNVSFACGFSGHGFKFAPVIGEALADLATRGRTDLPIDFLSLRRFRN